MRRKLEVRRIPKTGPNGDRDWKRHPYDDFDIVLHKGGEVRSLWYVNGFDPWHCHLRKTEDVLKELAEQVEKFEWALGLKARNVRLEKEVHTTEVWKIDVA